MTISDPHFRVEVISRTPNPQQVIYSAMHQDYSEGFVADEDVPSEEKCGELIIKHLLAGSRGHYGPLEHPQIVLNCGWFPHSTMQQMRTHRVGVSFDVQSFRYTGQRILSAVDNAINGMSYANAFEPIFYLRPEGEYKDREGKKYAYTKGDRLSDLDAIARLSQIYAARIQHQGFSEEHARGLIPFDVRQHWVMSANARSLMHLLDLRWKADAQLECQALCELIWPHFEAWMPAVAEWYLAKRAKKARLAP